MFKNTNQTLEFKLHQLLMKSTLPTAAVYLHVCLSFISGRGVFFYVLFETVKPSQTKVFTHTKPCTALESTWSIMHDPPVTNEMEPRVMKVELGLHALV